MRHPSFAGKFLGCVGLLFVGLKCAHGLHNGLALTPAMGFNNWDEMPLHYQPWANGFNESEVHRIAHTLVTTGLRDKGFVFLNLDCGWSSGFRSENGTLQVNSTLFPSSADGKGLAPLAEILHSMQLKLGIYTSGQQCCGPPGRNDGSEGKEEQDAATFAEWGIDYIKDDDCGSSADHFGRMQKAIAATKRPMLYSIHSPWTHAPTVKHPTAGEAVMIANSARTTNDISPTWSVILDRAHTNDQYANLSQPGYFNDPDMLEIGNAQLTPAEGRSQLAMWCVMKAPLLSGTDLSRATVETIATLSAVEVIAVNQDSLGVQGRMVHNTSGYEIWAGPLQHNCTVALVVNLGSEKLEMELSWSVAGLPANARRTVRNLWAQSGEGVSQGSHNVVVETAHDNAMFKLCPPGSGF